MMRHGNLGCERPFQTFHVCKDHHPTVRLDRTRDVLLQAGKLYGPLADREGIGPLFEALKKSPHRDNLVIHFHGGLVSQEAALASSGCLGHQFHEIGGHPIFFIWRSGFLEVVSRRILESVQNSFAANIFRFIDRMARLKFTRSPIGAFPVPTRIVPATLLEGNASELLPPPNPHDLPPETTLTEADRTEFLRAFHELLRTHPEVRASALALHERVLTRARVEGGKLLGSEALPGSSDSRTIRKQLENVISEAANRVTASLVREERNLNQRVFDVFQAVIARFASRRDHGYYTTVVEEILREFYVGMIGSDLWSTMKQDTEAAFHADARVHGGTAFLERLAADLRSRPLGSALPRITLIGHSAGAIFACHFVRAADRMLPANVKFDLIFLAPACDFDLFNNTVIRYADRRVRNIRIFSMEDRLELCDVLVQVPLPGPRTFPLPVIYPSSLLYFISGVLEQSSDWPLLGMERYHVQQTLYPAAAFPAIGAARRFLDSAGDRRIWSVKKGNGEGLNSACASHGGFCDEATTLESIKHIIRSGLPPG